MKDIIIIGTGKAAYIHYNSYRKFSKMGNIYFVDIDKNIKEENLKQFKVYSSIGNVISKEKLNPQNVIVDICTPKSVFIEKIKESKGNGIEDIIVEKPFIVKNDFWIENPELNIAMVHNYMYSKIVIKLKEIMEKENLQPLLIYTNFSKNRTEESFKGRGMYNKITRNIEHDIPHQVYISQFLLNNPKDTQVLFEEEKSMTKGEETLKNHGYSKIISKKNNVYIIHESDFSTNTRIREVIIVCKDDTVLKGEFLFYDKNLNKIKDGNVQVIKNKNIIYNENIDFDDNMYECLLEIYNYFSSNKKNKKYINEIKDFSKEMNLYM